MTCQGLNDFFWHLFGVESRGDARSSNGHIPGLKVFESLFGEPEEYVKHNF
jgi:hypothetical protein